VKWTTKEKPWGVVDPNSQHQLWSRWEFRVEAKIENLREIELNAARWLRKGFGSVGRTRVSPEIKATGSSLLIECEVEGVPAHDPDYVASVERGFRRFVDQGFGVGARASVDVKLLAGDFEDGKPRAQLIVVKRIDDPTFKRTTGAN
jgi:hypothetical protein